MLARGAMPVAPISRFNAAEHETRQHRLYKPTASTAHTSALSCADTESDETKNNNSIVTEAEALHAVIITHKCYRLCGV